MSRSSNVGRASGKKGAPTHDIIGMKDILDINRLEEIDSLEEKYTDGEDSPGSNVHVSHPNRNLNKVDINKPAYS